MNESHLLVFFFLSLQVKSKKRAIRLRRTKRVEDKILEEQKKREEEEKRKKQEDEERRKQEEEERKRREDEEREKETERKKKEEVAAALAAAKDKVRSRRERNQIHDETETLSSVLTF